MVIAMLTVIKPMLMKTLYKKDSKGKLRVLNIWAEGADLVQTSGLADGKLKEDRKTCKGKNIGKSNETTPEQQCKLEVVSKIAEKLKVDYFETAKEAMNSVVILPMLAKEYGKESKKIDWKKTVYVQPKMDGMRCLVFVDHNGVKLISRENTDILEQHGNSMKHIAEGMAFLPHGVYDGELYAHGYSFQENMELIKKYRPGESEEVKFCCYDFISDEPYQLRRKYILNAVAACDVVEEVRTEKIKNEDDLKNWHKQFVSEGFEGTIIRHGDEGYQIDKRSSYLLKYKDFIDLACKIVDVIPMENRPKQARLVCVCKNGEFKTNMRFSHKIREQILIQKKEYIGKTAEVRFFEYTDDGLPRFPVCVGFRLDK
jgi:DNA ligase-1